MSDAKQLRAHETKQDACQDGAGFQVLEVKAQKRTVPKKSPAGQPIHSGARTESRQIAYVLSSVGAAALDTTGIKVTQAFRLELNQYIGKKQTNEKMPDYPRKVFK